MERKITEALLRIAHLSEKFSDLSAELDRLYDNLSEICSLDMFNKD